MPTLTFLFLSVFLWTPFVNQKDSIKTKPVPQSLKNLFEQVIKKPDKSNDYEIEIDGLLVDDTKTKNGKDFYDRFYGSWQAPPGAKNYTITVSEKPFRLTSTLIVVSINENPVYQAILQPRQDIVEALSMDAISNTQNYLANYEEIMKQLNGDDMTGSGIF
jgi:curli production assembly/transport component CsgE